MIRFVRMQCGIALIAAVVMVTLLAASPANAASASTRTTQSGPCTTSGQPWGASYAWAVSGTVNVNQGTLIPFNGNEALCYSLGDTGLSSIGALKTHSRTFASSSYIPLGYCTYVSDTNWVGITFGGDWGSGMATATNWSNSDGHYWALGATFNEDLSGLYAATPSEMYMSTGYNNCISTGGCPDSQDISCNGHKGPTHNALTAANRRASRASQAPRRAKPIANPAGLTTVDRTFTREGTFSVQCPRGRFIANVDAATTAASTGPIEGAYVDHGLRTARVHVVDLPTGATATAQLVCRRADAKSYADGKMQWGPEGIADFTSTAKGQMIVAGAGDNHVTTKHGSVTVFGGLGADTIVLGKVHSVAVGGVGDDTLTDHSGSSILEGGLGTDVLTSTKGATIINAVDGSGNDRIVCEANSTASVMMDAGDTVDGHCGSVRVFRGAHA